MKKQILLLVLVLSLTALASSAGAQANQTPETLPVYLVSERGVATEAEWEQYLSSFYGAQYTAMALNEKEYKARGVMQWRNDNLGYIAAYGDTYFYLSRNSEYTIYETNMADGARSEEPWNTLEGKYTADEAMALACGLLDSAGITEIAPLTAAHSYSEDPTGTKERSNYYSFTFVPVYNGIPLADGYENLDITGTHIQRYIRVDVENSGISRVKAENLPVTCTGVKREIAVVDCQTIRPEAVQDSRNQEIVRMIGQPDASDLEIAAERAFFGSGGEPAHKAITAYTPVWNLRYVTLLEDGQLVMKPVWFYTAQELIDCEMTLDYTVLFDAETGEEIVL